MRFPSRTTSRPRRTTVPGLGTCKEGALTGRGVSNTFVLLGLSTLAMVGCGDDDHDDMAPRDAGTDAADTGIPDAAIDAPVAPCFPEHVDDPAPGQTECPVVAGGERDLYAEARGTAGLEDRDLVWTEDDLAEADYLPYLGDAFVLPAYALTHDDPANAPCFATELSLALDDAAASGHVLSRAIERAAAELGTPLAPDEPVPDPGVCDAPLARAALAFARAAGGDPDAAEVEDDARDVPPALQGAVAPILLAMIEALEAREYAIDQLGRGSAEDVAANAPDLVSPAAGAFGWLASRTAQDNVLFDWRTVLAQAARDVGVAIDHARGTLAAGGLEGEFAFDLDTPAGAIRVRDGGADVHGSDLDPTALLVDAGGDDEYRGASGANQPEPGEVLGIPISIVVDAGGRDLYGYDEVPTDYDGVGHRLPADGWGRNAAGDGPYCVWQDGVQYYGPISLSRDARQGAGIFGVGMLVDLGGGDDVYASLTKSQGFGAGGVGVLLDDGGDDSYSAESVSQGAASLGIGLLLDLGGSDGYVSYTESQAFAYVGSVAFLVDRGGDDSYVCDHGIPTEGGDPIFCSPQRSGGDGNSSFCQGAGFGMRGDGLRPPTFLAGGLGILRDRDGADRYEASVFGQGTGYWEGIGILSDGGGDDHYDAIWYVQGAAAHYAVAMLTDGGGDDVYNEREWTVGVAVGSGHDYSLGVLVDESGADRYFAAGNGTGDGNCNGIGLFVDNGGDDAYRSTTPESHGHAHISGECVRRTPALTGALFIDAAGTDTWDVPATGNGVMADGASFLHTSGNEGEHGAFLDAADGDSSFHVR